MLSDFVALNYLIEHGAKYGSVLIHNPFAGLRY